MSKKRDFKVMVVTQPPKNQWKQFVEIKKNHMNPRIKRPPFPHVTLLSPFFPYSEISKHKPVIETLLKDFKAFEMSFKKFKIFNNKKNSTLYLHPETDRKDALNDLFNILSTRYPNCLKRKNSPFRGHIGVGFFKGKGHFEKAQKLQERYQKRWKEIKYLCKEVYILSRVDDVSAFEVRLVCKFGGNKDSKTKTFFEEKKE